MAGLQVPVMPLAEVAGNEGAVPPTQILMEVPNAKVGVTIGFTETVKVVVVAHRPALGVNV